MKKQIVHLSIHQTAKVISLIYFVGSALFCIPFGIFNYLKSGASESLAMFLLPFAYMLMGYLFLAGFCWLYNLVTATFGGIEFTLQDSDREPKN